MIFVLSCPAGSQLSPSSLPTFLLSRNVASKYSNFKGPLF